MIPVIVVALVIVYVILKATGLFDELIKFSRDFQRGDSSWRQKYLKWVEEDPQVQERLEVFKDYLDAQPDDEPDS
jgi:hypothetical protein